MHLKDLYFIGICITIIALFFLSGAEAKYLSAGMQINDDNPVLNVIEHDSQRIVLEIVVPGFYSTEHNIKGDVYQFLHIAGEMHTSEPGKPKLPTIIRKIAIPDDKDVQVSIIRQDALSYEGFNVFPVERPTTDSVSIDDFVKDEQFYRQHTMYPAKTVRYNGPGIWRDCRIIALKYTPFQYNPAQKLLRFYPYTRIEISFSGKSDVNVLERKRWEIRPGLWKSYKYLILNFEQYAKQNGLRKQTSSKKATPKYLIIGTDDLCCHVGSLVDWRTKSGIYTITERLSNIGSTAEAIKNYITQQYNDNGIEYVLLVGDVDDLPAYNGYGFLSDHWYTLIEGDDLYSDINIGRIVALTAMQVQHQINKVLNYELDPVVGDWPKRTILAAHEQSYPGKYTECKEQIRTYNYNFVQPIFDTAYPPEGGNNEQVEAAINQGRGITNYRGHGDTTSWSWAPQWTKSNINRLNNAGKLSVVLNICCLNAAMDSSSETLAESWGYGQYGAVGNLAATDPSYTVENHTFDKEIYKAVYDQGVRNIMDVINIAKNVIIDQSSNGQTNAKMYLWLGDPANMIWSNSQRPVTVEHSGMVPIGESEFEVTVTTMTQMPVENAQVCLWQDENAYYTGFTDSFGIATIPVNPTEVGMMSICVTGQNILPYEATIPTMVSGCGMITIKGSTHSCTDQVTIKLWDADLNSDPGAIDTVDILIVSESDPAGVTVTLTETEPDIGAFEGMVQFSPSASGPDTIKVGHGDLVQAIYNDEDCEGEPQQSTDSTTTDCIGPNISGVDVPNMTNVAAQIVWTTDEPSNSIVRYGKTSELGNEEIIEDLEINHEVILYGLEEDTEYYFEVESVDPYGNSTVFDNGGQYIRFRTKRMVFAFYDDFNFRKGWSINGGQWERDFPQGRGGGTPPFGGGNPDPEHDHTSGTGKVIGTDLTQDGNYDTGSISSITSPSINCTGMTGCQLNFFQWLNVGEGMIPFGDGDNAFIDISGNGGFSWVEIWRNTHDITDNEWKERNYDISFWADNKPNVKVRFRLEARAWMSAYSGWNVDDVLIRGYAHAGVPTATPTFNPTYTPTPTGQVATPTPTATYTATPTPPGPTWTPSPTLPADTPTPTRVPGDAPSVRIAGYWDSRIHASSGGIMQIIAIADTAQGVPADKCEVCYGGLPIGLEIPRYNEGVFWLTYLPIQPGAPQGKFLMELMPSLQTIEGNLWPYFIVGD